MTKIVRTDQEQTIIIFQELSKHCKKGEDDLAIYEDGWDDQRIYASLQASNDRSDREYTVNMVERLRRKMFGRLNKTDSEGVPAMRSRIEALENRLAVLEDWIAKSTGGKYVPPIGRPRSTPPE